MMPTLEDHSQFDRYHINRWLGKGVSGESYEAIDTTLQRIVTLKLIHPWSVLSEFDRRQCFRELAGISTLQHPYLAPMLNYGEIDGRIYVVRRYVSSGSLLNADGRVWYQPPLPVATAIRFGSQLALALNSIHEQGYLHGSLTFANILVLRGGTIDSQDVDFAPFLLADVGLANFVRRFGQPGSAYLPLTAAPEQLGNRVTTASDQYALAVVLYFWLTGHPAFAGSPEEVARMKLSETILLPTTLNPHITAEQENILRRALSVYPEDRYPSIAAFAAALTATLDAELRSPSIVEEGTLIPVAETVIAPPLDQIPNPEPLPTPAPEPLPVPAPEPLPNPAPEPLPQPAPEPLPEPAPEPLPVPAPEPLIQPAPDVYTPLPVTQPVPESPPAPLVNEGQTGDTILQNSAPLFPPAEVRFSLIITVPNTSETFEFALEQNEITIGRAGDSDLLLEQDAQASRHHALLRREYSLYRLYDLHSASGIFVNGAKLPLEEGLQLAAGDKIRIGNHEMVFHQMFLVASQSEPGRPQGCNRT